MDISFPLEKITCVALTEDQEIISYHRDVDDARKVPDVAYIRPAKYEWYDATQPDEWIDLGYAFRDEIDLDDDYLTAEDREEYEGQDEMRPCIYITFGNCHAFCTV